MQIENTKQIDPMWTGRVQELLHAVRVPLYGEIEKLTVGWILETLHDLSGEVPKETQAAIQQILPLVPGYKEENAEIGLYHYAFVRQLEYLCSGARDAFSRGLIY